MMGSKLLRDKIRITNRPLGLVSWKSLATRTRAIAVEE